MKLHILGASQLALALGVGYCSAQATVSALAAMPR